MTRLSRRAVLGSIGAVPALSGGLVLATQTRASTSATLTAQDRLQAALRDLPLPCTPGHLEVIKFEENGPEIRIVVRLSWQPGRRQQMFGAHHDTRDQSVIALIEDVTAWVGKLV
ncbi:hypothetical protein Q4555_15595 [Octadecabacter sp. 1_MG-2023]|uniref:hypothetical protein n=1 Tax=unclassified Octadecabacter TaxID=196158 RepID=UPI001C07F8D6|nr:MULTISPECIES: hypothetical protein [unclassified Octadecabacter]MBU2994044.1 hypothetical protein [Octadecabacter sp. B2R22]MDO6736102.1 hypothetical protein [Octadecabacter sp. 1_MG-2023]